ncbi:lysoplasmalogenase [Fluviispira multicolorata]|uniref:YhhN-like protein n=1 Tax=Fluviispira multicolorata TaxID=2654512 RepID=A0A833JES0_9BACT|nr:lysoplasmalogenase [Fluviispira multicolorata]KAB8033360.1 hypothetical protein GCL57_01275 [Fluviispira multicolorata]
MFQVNGLIIISAIFSFIYLLSLNLYPFKLHWLIKGMSIIAIAIYSFFYIPNSFAFIFAVSLLFSACGDMFLAYDGQKFFIQGLISFLISHIIYAYIFFMNSGHFLNDLSVRVFLLVLMLTFFTVMLKVLSQKVGNLKIPVFIYMTALSCMVIASILIKDLNYLLILGALLFVLSDTLLAIQKFINSYKGINYFIWITYYFAQMLLLAGMFKL